MEIAIVGAGRVGTALGVAWARAGHDIVAVAGRAATPARAAAWLPGVPVEAVGATAGAASIVVLGVPDDALDGVVTEVARSIRPGTVVVHLSGALGLDVLEPVRRAAGRALAVHPLQTFADVAGAVDALSGCAFAVTADDARRVSCSASGWLATPAACRSSSPTRTGRCITPPRCSPPTISWSSRVRPRSCCRPRGCPTRRAALAPLQRATLANVDRLGAARRADGARRPRATRAPSSATWPRSRAATPALVPPYVALCRAAIRVAGDRLTERDRDALEEVLARWS